MIHTYFFDVQSTIGTSTNQISLNNRFYIELFET